MLAGRGGTVRGEGEGGDASRRRERGEDVAGAGRRGGRGRAGNVPRRRTREEAASPKRGRGKKKTRPDPPPPGEPFGDEGTSLPRDERSRGHSYN